MAGNVGPGFQWNILNYGRILNNVRAQEFQFQQAIVTFQNTVLMANEETENAVTAFLREQERLRFLEAAVRATSKAAELALLQYEKGLVDYQPVLDTQRDLVVSQDQVASSRGLIGAHLVAIYKALAGGWLIPQQPANPPPAPSLPEPPAELIPHP